MGRWVGISITSLAEHIIDYDCTKKVSTIHLHPDPHMDGTNEFICPETIYILKIVINIS